MEQLSVTKEPIFGPDWPRYAVVAHIIFWSLSALLILGALASYMGLIRGEIFIHLFFSWIVSAFGLCLSAVFSGRLYVGNQVFAKRPLVGWLARIYGAVVTVLFAFIMWFFYGLLYLAPH